MVECTPQIRQYNHSVPAPNTKQKKNLEAVNSNFEAHAMYLKHITPHSQRAQSPAAP
jgi:hypothetical protein